MFPASTNSASGQCFAFPDVCKTPTPAGPVPSPYPNIARLQMANPGTLAMTVSICGFPAATQKTVIPISNGDEAGVAGGVVSSSNMGSCKFTLSSMTVKIEGAGAVYHGGVTVHNKHSSPNMPIGAQVAPSQPMVTVGP